MGKIEEVLGECPINDKIPHEWSIELNKGTLAKVHIQNENTRIEMTVEEFIQSFAPGIAQGASNLRQIKGLSDG